MAQVWVHLQKLIHLSASIKKAMTFYQIQQNETYLFYKLMRLQKLGTIITKKKDTSIFQK